MRGWVFASGGIGLCVDLGGSVAEVDNDVLSDSGDSIAGELFAGVALIAAVGNLDNAECVGGGGQPIPIIAQRATENHGVGNRSVGVGTDQCALRAQLATLRIDALT